MSQEKPDASPKEVKKAMNMMSPRKKGESRERERWMNYYATRVAEMKEDGTLYERYAAQVLLMEEIKRSEERRKARAAENPNFITMGDDGGEGEKIMMEMMERELGPKAEEIRNEVKEDGKRPGDYLTIDDLERLAKKYPVGGYAEDYARRKGSEPKEK